MQYNWAFHKTIMGFIKKYLKCTICGVSVMGWKLKFEESASSVSQRLPLGKKAKIHT